ncbi:MAG: hypothetical protein ABH842_04090 [Candidatus Micrarchaeota archaeon]
MKKGILICLIGLFLFGCTFIDNKPKLEVGIMIHVEGWNNEAFEESSFERHAEAVRKMATTLEAYGLRGTFEVSEEFIDGCKNWDDNVLLELKNRGHSIGVHADVGGNLEKENLTQQEFGQTISLMKKKAEQLTGSEIEHVSGICSELDWVTAAIDAGYRFTTGGVAYCVMSLPENKRPDEFKYCKAPGVCHDTYPTELEDRLRPWKVSSGLNWLENDEQGKLVYFPSEGVVYALSEEKAGNLPEGAMADFDQNDIDVFFEVIDEAIALSNTDNTSMVYFAWSIGSADRVENNDVLFENWLGKIKREYIDTGKLEWKTINQMYHEYIGDSNNYTINNNISLTQNNQTSEKKYVTFVLNVHDWVFPEKSADVIEKTIDTHEEYQVPVDIYIDDAVFQNLVKNHPQLVQKLKNSNYATVCYHFRPPMPAYADFDSIGLSKMNQTELYNVLKAYEEHELDLVTGNYTQNPGGYQFIKDTIGYAPVIVGSTGAGNTDAVLEKIYAEKGAKISVVNQNEAKLGEFKKFLYVRPQQVEIKLYEENLGYMHGDANSESIIQTALSEYTGNADKIFINIKMHENNYYTQYTSWWPTYFTDHDKTTALEPPYNLSLSANLVRIRPQNYTDSMWDLYESTVNYVVENEDIFITVGANDVVEMLPNN